MRGILHLDLSRRPVTGSKEDGVRRFVSIVVVVDVVYLRLYIEYGRFDSILSMVECVEC